MLEKACSTCKKTLPAAEFYPHRRMKSGLQSQCRQCARQWHRDRPEMMDAAIALIEAGPCFPQDIYAAMIKAAPNPPASLDRSEP